MKKTTKMAIAAASVLALGAAGTFALTAPGEAEQSGWYQSARGQHAGHRMMRGMHGTMRGMHGGFGMHMGRGMMIDHLFNMADTDGDGTITREEFERAIADRIDQHDEDGDGSLDIEEYEGLFLEIVRPLMVRSFQFFDHDGSGAIAAEDMERPLGRLFDHLDRAGEGEITRDQMRRGHRWHARMHRDGGREMRRDRREMRRDRDEMRREGREERGMRRMRERGTEPEGQTEAE